MDKAYLSLTKPTKLNSWRQRYRYWPFKKTVPSVMLIGFRPDSQRYFDIHHTPNDVFENVNKRELELGAAAMAALIYLIDQHGL
jgi:carboxypeptidase Q